jgi:hypothetical protein
MNKKFISIHQPNYLPWAGYFFKILKSDTFVFLDDVQVSKQSFFNRVKVSQNNSETWLTVPSKINLGLKINEVTVSQNDWKNRHKSKLYNCYKETLYFKTIWKLIEELYDLESTSNVSYNNQIFIKFICNLLNIETKFLNSSKLSLDTNKTSDDKLIDIVKISNSKDYLSGIGGLKYQDISKFDKNNICLVYIKNLHKKYNNNYNTFFNGLSIIDLLFNLGQTGTIQYLEDNFIIEN